MFTYKIDTVNNSIVCDIVCKIDLHYWIYDFLFNKGLDVMQRYKLNLINPDYYNNDRFNDPFFELLDTVISKYGCYPISQFDFIRIINECIFIYSFENYILNITIENDWIPE